MVCTAWISPYSVVAKLRFALRYSLQKFARFGKGERGNEKAAEVEGRRGN
jgi:hypothetical protein